MQKRLIFAICVAALLGACDKHDPILPGTRTAIFDNSDIRVIGGAVPNLPTNAPVISDTPCPYTQDSSNVIRNADNNKVFSGFPTNNSVSGTQKPVCAGKYVYAGLSTGEVVKINPASRTIVWIADVYRASNMTGGASMVDIIAPIVVHNGAIYVGGLGDAFCKINSTSGVKKWCVEIGVAVPFIVLDDVSFVVATDGNAYAIRNSDGAIYWRSGIKKQIAPKYANGILTVGRDEINAETGEIKD